MIDAHDDDRDYAVHRLGDDVGHAALVVHVPSGLAVIESGDVERDDTRRRGIERLRAVLEVLAHARSFAATIARLS